MRRILWCGLLWGLLIPVSLQAQDAYYFQSDFPPEEFAERRAQVYDHIGNQAIALIQGASQVDGFRSFRQTNTFYYLCGLETPNAYLLLDGRSRRTTLYLPHRNAGRERSEGKTLAAEDAELVKELTGADDVKPVEQMMRDWVYGGLVRTPHPIIYTPFSPAEIGTDSRDELLSGHADAVNDPWDGRPSREGHFIHLLRTRYPQFEIRNLSPFLDELRTIKSEREIAMIRRATELAGWGLMEAMRSTEVGVYEYQLAAAARYVHQVNGSRRDGYNAIVGGGTNAWMGHYHRNTDPLRSGDTVLLDFAPELRYYTSDVTRMWPVNGTFTDAQLELYNFVVAYRDAFIRYIKPGVTPDEVLRQAAADMAEYIDRHTFSKPIYEQAVRAALDFRGHLQHPVGMAVHDVGNYKRDVLLPGHVFAVDPMIWVPEEKLYVRIEDVVVITETGVENMSDFVPAEPEAIEALMREPGIVQLRPATPPRE